MNRSATNRSLLLIVILSLSIMSVVGNDQDKGIGQIKQPASSVNDSQDEQAIKNVALDKGDPLYPKNIDGLSKEELIKRGFGTVNPSYPKNIDGLSKEELIKRGFDKKDDNRQKEKDSEDNTGGIAGYDICKIGPAVDNIAISWYASPTTIYLCGWYGQNAIYYYGGDAARSSDISNNEKTSMETNVLGPGKVSFFWSVSSEANYDYLEFYIDGYLKDRISGNVPWQLKSYSVWGDGKHTFRWRYIKDGSVSVGEDAGFVDKVVWTGRVSLADALDTSNNLWIENVLQDWTTWGDANWFGQQTTYIYNGAAAQSGSIGHSSHTTLQNYIQGQGRLSFWWKVSSEANYDYLEFYIDGYLKDRISGGTLWQYKTYLLGPGSHTVLWNYKKDGSVSIGSDAGWVDSVRLFPTVTLYANINYGGAKKTFESNTPGVGSDFNDITSSLRMSKGYCTTLYAHADYGEPGKSFCADTYWVGSDFNDITSSLKLWRR